jgi:ABC-type lipoprotein release transport system permease subunit
MRAIGTYRKQIRRMIFIESSIIAIFGAALGTGLGIFFAWSLIQTLADEGFTVFSVSIQQTFLWIGIAILLVLLLQFFQQLEHQGKIYSRPSPTSKYFLTLRYLLCLKKK